MSFNYSLNFSYFPISAPIVEPTTSVADKSSINIKFYPIWYKHVTMEWDIPVEWGNCTFNVFKSATEDGPFEQINITPISTNYIKDSTTEAFSKFNKDFYILEVILPSGSTIRSRAVSWRKTRHKMVELKALDIQRREYLLMSKFSGAETLVFRRKTYGERCPDCWNYDTERIMDDKCPTCLGTSFNGGFFTGIKTYLQYETTPNAISLTYFGKFEPNQLGAWTISYPELNSLDVIIRLNDWKAYRIERIVPTELATVPVRQILQLTELDKTSVEYKLVTRDLTEFPGAYQ